ncbi:amylo-alpha-1,6-glucosidase [Paenibacillus sp. MBLB4367]|uniref:amylo-alpha-1,6-glucosidase n=1 Tax=Paenibacillus sp. MBLB4367 TaxID=3384767 RepID=UPI00390815B1
MDTTSLLSVFPNMPDVWGEGLLFAFSGLDGQTVTESQFVATAAKERFGLLFHTPSRRVLRLRAAKEERVRIATGDVLLAETADGPLLAVYRSWHTLVGRLPANGSAELTFEDTETGESASLRVTELPGDGMQLGEEESAGAERTNGGDAGCGTLCLTEDAANGDVIALWRNRAGWVLAYGKTAEDARARVREAQTADPFETAAARLRIYGKRTPLSAPGRERLFNKCVSVMKVNTLSAEGAIRRTWSTPDRVPHRAMWLWDSVFHSFAMNRIDADVSADLLKAVLDAQREDGMIPHMCRTDGTASAITQPPVLAWGVRENYRYTKRRSDLAYALPRLERYMGWLLANRDRNGNGLLEWMIEGNPLCRSGESGMDNSPRFDEAAALDAVDFSVYAAADMRAMSAIAEELGERERAAEWRSRSEAVSAAVHRELWDETEGFYFDRHMDGRMSAVKAVSGFLPLLLDDLPQVRIDRLVAMLRDPRHFGTAFPVPTVARSDSSFGTDMWRGPVWICMNYMIAEGLRKHGRKEEAERLSRMTVAAVAKNYERYGVVFEYFDAEDRVAPPSCYRKGPPRETYDIRRKLETIRDFHWSAALTACLLMDPAPVAAGAG